MFKRLGQYFFYSIRLPQKQAVFNLNRIGMDTTVIYLFILIGFISMPELFYQLFENKTGTLFTHPFFVILFFFSFYYLPLVIIIFITLSLISYLITLFATAFGRKLRFSIMWKMAASATTIPLIVFGILTSFLSLSNYFLLLANIFIFAILIKIVFIYPRVSKRLKRT